MPLSTSRTFSRRRARPLISGRSGTRSSGGRPRCRRTAPDIGNKVDDNDVEIDNDDLADLSDDIEAMEAAAEQWALMASFETKHRNDSA
jgi:hypothetical protein